MLGGFTCGQPNNSFNPTRDSMALIILLAARVGWLSRGRVNSGVRRLVEPVETRTMESKRCRARLDCGETRLKVVRRLARVIHPRSGVSSQLGASRIVRVEGHCNSAGGLNGRVKKGLSGCAWRARLRRAPPNNSLQRSANSAACIREARVLVQLSARPLNSGVRLMPAYSGG